MDFERLIARVKNILITPKTEWPLIAAEPASSASIYLNYAMIVAAIGPISTFIGMTIFGMSLPLVGTIKVPLTTGILQMVVGYVLSLGMLYVMGLLVDALAPTFGGEKNFTQALKTVAYAYTAAWVAAVLNIVPLLGMLALIGGIYSIYLIYVGLPHTMKCPPEKAGGYTAVIVLIGIVLSICVGMVIAIATGTNAAMQAAMQGG